MNLRLGKITPKFTLAEAALLTANLLPLAGVAFWGWDGGQLFFLFWLENVIIGFINVLRMTVYCIAERAYAGVILIAFFIFHYGMFTAVHGVFTMMFVSGRVGKGGEMPAPDVGPSPEEVLLQTFSDTGIMIGAAALFASHFISFIINFFLRGEIKTVTVEQLMFAPYGRVIILHLSLLAGFFILLATGEAVGGLVLLIIFKIFLDLAAHRRERARLGKAMPDKLE